MKMMLMVWATFVSQYALASKDRGGGDLCENRIQIIRDDIQSWIKKGGPKELNLPLSISVEKYSELMLSQIENATIECVAPGDVGYPVEVDGVPKVCRFDQSSGENPNQPRIKCDFNKFQNTEQSDQYILIHHEYAGLAGLENPNGAESTYVISNQLKHWLESEIVQVLVVKPKSELPDDFVSFTYPSAEIAFQNARVPTAQELTGEWLVTGIANPNFGKYWSNGRRTFPNVYGRFNDISKFSELTDVLGAKLTTRVDASLLADTGKVTRGPTTKFQVSISPNGATSLAAFFLPSTPDFCLVNDVCRIIEATGDLLCAQYALAPQACRPYKVPQEKAMTYTIRKKKK